ncbi:MAG TPA: hypothetical protein VH186_38525 [Chloroflexia bacterium]|nr:hypothetical protein [Chloroflexia bacterium]
MNEENKVLEKGCEVCGQTPPPGHRICDNCWPDEAIKAGAAAICSECGRPRMVEKLARDAEKRLVCKTHLA